MQNFLVDKIEEFCKPRKKKSLYPLKVGHVDFYPNQGRHPQPGCEEEGLGLDCSHQRAHVSLSKHLLHFIFVL